MDELKPGYRPDTVLIQNLPLKWFGRDNLKTNWLINVFSVFGDIRRFHVPLIDEIEKEKISHKKKGSSEVSSIGFKKFNFNSENSTFDAYLMYKDYVGFVNAMDGLRGMKLVKCEKVDDYKTEYLEHEIKVDFDKTKHLSDKTIRLNFNSFKLSLFLKLNHFFNKLQEKTNRQKVRYRDFR